MQNQNAENEYECALSGKVANDAELVVDDAQDDADLDALPVGWVKVTVQRRGVNPAWIAIQRTKAHHVASIMAQVGDDMSPEERAAQAEIAEVTINANFYALEAGTPKYVVVEDVAYVANPDTNKQVQAEWVKIASSLGVDVSGSG